MLSVSPKKISLSRFHLTIIEYMFGHQLNLILKINNKILHVYLSPSEFSETSNPLQAVKKQQLNIFIKNMITWTAYGVWKTIPCNRTWSQIDPSSTTKSLALAVIYIGSKHVNKDELRKTIMSTVHSNFRLLYHIRKQLGKSRLQCENQLKEAHMFTQH